MLVFEKGYMSVEDMLKSQKCSMLPYQLFYQLIEEHFVLIENFKQLEKNYDDLYDKKENTISFKHFHLLADSTLKSQNKEYLIDYIHMLYHNFKISDTGYNDMINYASVLQDKNARLQSQLVEYQRICKQKQDIIDELTKGHDK